MSRSNQKRKEAQYIDEEEIARHVRDEKLRINEVENELENDTHDTVDEMSGPTAAAHGIGLGGAPQTDRIFLKSNQSGGTFNGNKDPLGYYKTLGVSPAADALTIRKAFLALSQAYHSDKHSQQDQVAQGYMNERFQQLTEAYEVLSDPRLRAAYDHSGGTGVARLELVPLTAVTPEEVKKYLTLLQTEAQLKRTERLISSSSSATIHISVAHLFSSLEGPQEGGGHAPPNQKQRGVRGSNDAKQQSLRRDPGGRPNIDAFAKEKVPETTSDKPVTEVNKAGDAHPEETYEEAFKRQMAADAAEKVRLRESLEKAPPRWQPSDRGFGENAYPFLQTPETSSATNEHQARVQKDNQLPPQDEAHKQSLGAGKSESAGETNKSKSENPETKDPTPPTSAPQPSSNPPQQHAAEQQQQQHAAQGEQQAQLAEVLINGEPTVVAILPPQVVAAVRAQFPNGIPNGEQQQQQQQGKNGMLRRPPNARSQQALQKIPLAVLLSLDFIYMYNLPIGDRTNISFRTAAKKNNSANANSDGANVGISIEHVLSQMTKLKLTIKATFDLLRLQCSVTRVLSAATTLTNKVTLYSGGYYLRDFSMSLTRRLTAALTMTNTLTLTSAASGGSFNTAAQYALSGHQMVAGSIDLSFGSVGIGANYIAKLSKKVKAVVALRTQCFAGVSECSYELWYLRSHLQQIGVGASVALPYSYNIFTGITSANPPPRLTQLFILLARGENSIRIPIVVVVNDHVAKLLLFAAIPILGVSVGRLALRPFSNLHMAKAYQRARSLYVKEVASARRKAEIEMLALHSVVSKKRAAEEVVNGGGLVIVKALYGVLHPEVAVLPPITEIVESLTSPLSTTGAFPPPGTNFSLEPTATNAFILTHDVTDALQNLVHSSALVLAEGSKDSLPGFFNIDPATSEKRHISVIYLFKRKVHRVEIEANEALTLPLEEHIDRTVA